MCEKCINDHIQKEENKNHYYYIIRKVIKNNKSCFICPKHDLEYTHYITEAFALGFHICDKCEVREDDDWDIIYIEKEKGECYFNQLKKILNKNNLVTLFIIYAIKKISIFWNIQNKTVCL